jgi:hypothetical protein
MSPQRHAFDVLGWTARLVGRIACLCGHHDWQRSAPERFVANTWRTIARCRRCLKTQTTIDERPAAHLSWVPGQNAPGGDA